MKQMTENPSEAFKGRLNIYVCKECRGHIVSKDVDDGVTPFMIRCEATVGCTGMMASSFYRVFDQAMKPSHEWYRPSAPEAAALKPNVADHVSKGGLLIRRCDGKPAVNT